MSKQFLGRGWPFPVEVDANGKLPYSLEEKKICESALIILGTARGERVMRPDFGSRLHELVFSPMNASTQALASHYAIDALVQWEPRIDVLHVNVTEDASAFGTLLIDIEYRIRSTNSIFNLVYPFYLKGGKN
jgi:phage baseplate assembly protein W